MMIDIKIMAAKRTFELRVTYHQHTLAVNAIKDPLLMCGCHRAEVLMLSRSLPV